MGGDTGDLPWKPLPYLLEVGCLLAVNQGGTAEANLSSLRGGRFFLMSYIERREIYAGYS